MIALERTRAELLARIDAREDIEWTALDDATDARFLSGDYVRLCVEGHSRDDLFPVLNLALSQRLHNLARGVCVRDVLAPLKNGLGNAYKRGHGRDRSKTIGVEVVATPRGVFVALTDEGPGFDIAQTYHPPFDGEPRSRERGAGFRAYERSGATVSFENSGRTLLLCRPYSPAEQARANDTGSATATGEDALARGLIEALGDRRGAAQSCRAYRNRRDDPWDARFAVRFDASPSTSIYTGRRFANDTDARADIQRTRMVREQLGHGKLHFAEPVARLAEQPRLVVYDFDPWLNLTEYLDDRGDVAVVQRATQRVGLVLSMLHGSSLHLETSSWEDYREGIALAASEWSKEAAGDVTRDSARWRAVWETCQRGLEATDNVPAVPGHGALRWAHIHYGVDGRFYLSHWERCARRHPGIDTASFVADLLTYTYQRNDARLFEVGLDSFARAYCGDAPTAAWWNQLPALVAGEIVARHADELFIGESSLELVERACAMQLP